MTTFDKYLTYWILLAIVFGALVGTIFPSLPSHLSIFQVGTTNVLIAIMLILMVYPAFTKVNYSDLKLAFQKPKVLTLSLILNWIIGPCLMFALAIIFLHDHPPYMIGLILTGLSRCIAMVLVWNALAKGHCGYCTSLVALNSLFQILVLPAYAIFFMEYLPGKLGFDAQTVTVSMGDVALNIGVYVGIPFILAAITRQWLTRNTNKHLTETFQRWLGYVTPVTLLSTIVLLFALNAKAFTSLAKDAVLIAIPLAFYFFLMYGISFFLAKKIKTPTDETIALSLTASSNNFELAIALAIGIFGINSGEAFACIIGPLVEVPIALTLVKISLYLQRLNLFESKESKTR